MSPVRQTFADFGVFDLPAKISFVVETRLRTGFPKA